MEITLNKEYRFCTENVFTTTSKLEIHAPTSKNAKFFAPLKQMFFQALSELKIPEDEVAAHRKSKEDGEDEKSPEITREMCLFLLNNSIKVDMGNFYEKFKPLLCAPRICTVTNFENGKPCNLNPSDYDNLEMVDAELLVGEYVKNFLLPSN